MVRGFIFSLVMGMGLGAVAQKQLVYRNHIYESSIKTVQLYIPGAGVKGGTQSAVITLAEQPGLRLEFDDITDENVRNYYARIVRCDYTWKPSSLSDLDFMGTYNEFRIDDYTFSSGTRIPYTHYRFTVPRVKLAGNYLLVVYRDGDPSDMVLSCRFMVYNNTTELIQEGPGGAMTLHPTDQRLQFTINYQRLEVIDPSTSMHLVIRQNRRWDNAKFDVKPTEVREIDRQLEYKCLDEGDYFTAGNEFRFVDFRSLNSPGQNTGYLDKSKVPFHLQVQADKSKAHQAYARYPDLDGGYYIANLDYTEPATTSDYLNVTFHLATSLIPDSRIYVIGRFNQWAQNKTTEMQYDSSSASYRYTTFLKQGWYDYRYTIQSPTYPPYHLEGSHFETENEYEVLLYHRPFSLQADILVGYFVVPVNTR